MAAPAAACGPWGPAGMSQPGGALLTPQVLAGPADALAPRSRWESLSASRAEGLGRSPGAEGERVVLALWFYGH